MKPGDLVNYKGNGKCYLISEVRKIKGEVRYFHLDTFHHQRVFYPDDVKVINESLARRLGKNLRLGFGGGLEPHRSCFILS